MCGIAGVFDLRGKRPIDRPLLSRMSEVLAHRGPDGSGLHIEPGIGLGHRRLSIIDLSTGQQPLYNEDGAVVVVYNGEIYNFPELTSELARSGHVFRTHCDTEVIVHGWEEWGEDCVRHFRGMFAFALWDRHRETLFLARDRLGIKPLYYAVLPDGHLLFASELKSLLIHPDLRREIDLQALEDYFALGYVPEPKTILCAARKLAPGHTLSLRRGENVVRPREYWDVPFRPVECGTEEDVAHELVDRLREAVKIRLISDVPLGAFLSGGVDSSSVVAMMSEVSSEAAVTCSISFGDPAFNESRYAEAVAARYRTNHSVDEVSPDDFALVDELAGIYDEPYADSSAMPTYRVCQLARKRVTVALSGDGGDENLGGYRRYRWHVYEEGLRVKIPLPVRRPAFGLLGALYPKADWAPKVFRAKSTLESLARDSVHAYFHTVSVQTDAMRMKLYDAPFKRALQGYHAKEVLLGHALRAPEHPLSKVQYLDMKTYLAGDILTKVDRASMAHSLEVRVPFLDHPFVEWMSGLPPDLKLRRREGKYILKKAMRAYLPEDLLYRPKMGFSVPLASWFRGPLRERVRRALLGPALTETGLFNRRFLRRMIEHHESGRRDFSTGIWTLLMFEAFLRRVQESPGQPMQYPVMEPQPARA